MTATVNADNNPSYNTDPGNSTQDKVFILSITETDKYFDSNVSRKCVPTDYAKSHGVHESEGQCWWWLRSPGKAQGYVAGVGYNGSIDYAGFHADSSCYGIRPAMWIDTSIAYYERTTGQESYAVGSTVTFGTYEQDGDTSNGSEPIEWTVLEKDDDKALVMSKYVLDCKEFDTLYKALIAWDNCSLRQWLNGEFIDNAFSSDERLKILTVTVTAEKNPSYDTYAGKDSQDNVFCLSINEINEHHISNGVLKCQPTTYAMQQGAYKDSDGNSAWWLRTPGYHSNDAAIIDVSGTIDFNGVDFRKNNIGIRPAMWISIK